MVGSNKCEGHRIIATCKSSTPVMLRRVQVWVSRVIFRPVYGNFTIICWKTVKLPSFIRVCQRWSYVPLAVRNILLYVALSRECEWIHYVQCPPFLLVCIVSCSEHYGAARAVHTPGEHSDLDMRCAGALLPWNATSPRRRLVPLRPSCHYTGTPT
jgi:hypothetical protein